MTAARLARRVPGVPQVPRGFSFLDPRDDSCWSDGLRWRVDALPRGGDCVGPCPGCRLGLQAVVPSVRCGLGGPRRAVPGCCSFLGLALASSPSLVILSLGVSQGCDLRYRVEDGVQDAMAAA